MLRTALFVSVISGGSIIFENLELLNKERAWLLCAVIASVLMYLIPEPGKRRDPTDLIFGLVVVMGTYAISFKMRPWLADLIGGAFAGAVSTLVILGFGAALILLTLKRGNSTTNATP